MASVIPWTALLWCIFPLAIVTGIYLRWRLHPGEVLMASLRMFVQLMAVGYVLLIIFDQPSVWVSASVVVFMLIVSAWIALRPVRGVNGLIAPAVSALGASVILHLVVSVFLVLRLEQWYQPQVIIPLAGMYFANTMNALSLAAERFISEQQHNPQGNVARDNAFKSAMIPQLNSLFAVGLVALPGMMTGQILSGVSPLIAVRYQIMIMTMLLGCAGLACAIFLSLLNRNQAKSP